MRGVICRQVLAAPLAEEADEGGRPNPPVLWPRGGGSLPAVEKSEEVGVILGHVRTRHVGEGLHRDPRPVVQTKLGAAGARERERQRRARPVAAAGQRADLARA